MHQAPGVDQIGILELGDIGQVRDQVRLHIEALP